MTGVKITSNSPAAIIHNSKLTCTLSSAAWLISGPALFNGSKPLPQRIFFTLAVSFCENSSYTPFCTKMRFEEIHVWPVFLNMSVTELWQVKR